MLSDSFLSCCYCLSRSYPDFFSSMLSKTASSLSFSPDIMRGAHACALATKDAQNKCTSLSCLAPSRPSATHVVIRNLKQGRRPRQWKRRSKNEFAFFQTFDFSWSWILKDFIEAQKDEGKFVVVCPRPPWWCYTRRFATTIFSITQRCNIVATLF